MKTARIPHYLLILVSLILLTCCAPAKKNSYYSKKKKASHVSAEQLGRNKYFFTPKYQKKLTSKYKKR